MKHAQPAPLSAREAARLAGIPKRTVLADIENGLLKAQKLPGPLGAWVIDPDDFAEYRHTRAARARHRRRTRSGRAHVLVQPGAAR